VAAAPLGLAPDGSLAVALAGAATLAVVLGAFSFPLRWRALLWLLLAASVPLLEPGRAPGLLVGAVAGYAFFTVVVWGTVYYRLRTGAPWTNFLRFWRLVLTNSDPTSGNALEQVPKLVMALSAGVLLAGLRPWRRWRSSAASSPGAASPGRGFPRIRRALKPPRRGRSRGAST
jgi:hypothetical protein